MFVAIALVFPILLLLATLGMERVERPLDEYRTRDDIERLLDDEQMNGRPDEVEEFVAHSYRRLVRRYWRRAWRNRADTAAPPGRPADVPDVTEVR